MKTILKQRKSHQMAIRITPEDLALVSQIAEREERTVSDVIRRWIREKLSALEKDTSTGARK